MNKEEVLLLALSTAPDHPYTPVQIQKLLFLIDRNVGQYLGGNIFSFVPYDYGPFDKSIYEALNALESNGLLEAIPSPQGWKYHKLTAIGCQASPALASSIPEPALQYIQEASDFVRRLSFADLVSAIYNKYPEMKSHSVFRG